MIVCPLCGTSNINSFIGSMLNTHISSNFIRASVRCTYCSDDFYVETDLRWKTSKDTARIANPKYKLLKQYFYRDENKNLMVLALGSEVELQGFELSSYSLNSPFKTKFKEIIRIPNKLVKRIK